MPTEPSTKRTVAFFDGQNLFHAAKAAYGHTHPNYDPIALARAISQERTWQLDQVRFYTGIPSQQDNPFWQHFWAAKLSSLKKRGAELYSRTLRYRNETTTCANCGVVNTTRAGDEKGIDVRLALDAVRLAQENKYDVALIFSQDQDLSELARDVRLISRQQNRWIKIASAYPPTPNNARGINDTDWIKIDRRTYDACLDPRDYRPSHGS